MPTIFEYVQGDSTLKTLADLLEKSGYSALLGRPGEYTLFAPNDTAFGRTNILKLLDDPNRSKATLTYHLVPGKITSAELCTQVHIGTVYGKALTVEFDEGDLIVDNAKVVARDIECSNGIIHIIDNVFQPLLSGYYYHEKLRWHREDTL